MKNSIISFGITNKGLKRKINEDYILINKTDKLFLLADGMGGHKAGDIAGKLSCTLFDNYFQKDCSQSIKDKLFNSFTKMNCYIYNESEKNKDLFGMGATFIACNIADFQSHFCHVGDVRAYLFRDNSLVKLTQDHSYVAKLLQDKIINNNDIKDYPFKNIVTKAVGMNKTVEPDYNVIEIKTKDKILLCSDGLWNLVNDDKIIDTLNLNSSIDVKAKTLTNLANNSGGNDNISLIIIELN